MKLEKKQLIRYAKILLAILFLINSGFFSALVDASHTEQQKTIAEIETLSRLEQTLKTASVEEQQQAARNYKEALENRISGRDKIPTLPQIGINGLWDWCKKVFLYLLPWLIVLTIVKSYEKCREPLQFARPLNLVEMYKLFSTVQRAPLLANKGSPLEGFVMELEHIPDTLTDFRLIHKYV